MSVPGNEPGDRIHIEGLKVRAIVGTLPHERRRRQPLRLSLTLFLSLEAAGRSDELARTVDYARVAERVISFVARSRFRLLEALAEGVAALVLEEFSLAGVRVRIDKPAALARARSAAVEITRSASERR